MSLEADQAHGQLMMPGEQEKLTHAAGKLEPLSARLTFEEARQDAILLKLDDRTWIAP